MPISTSSNSPLSVRADGNDDLALADDRLLELRNLVALRQVRIEIVLAVEDASVVDLRLQPEAGAHGLADALLVDDGQHAGHGGIDQRDIGVRLGAEFGRGAGEQLGIGNHLGMDFHADDNFPVAGGAGNEAFRIGRTGIDDGHQVLVFLKGFSVHSIVQRHIACKPRFQRKVTASHGYGGTSSIRWTRLPRRS
jgi:hypothetical protein